MPDPAPELAAAYARLGLAPGADAAAVKAAFRRLARGLHPDHNPDAPAEAMAALNADYAMLCAHLARPGVRAYSYDMWAPKSGEREFRLDNWAMPTTQTAFSGETWAPPITQTAMSNETWAMPSA
ncbi:MAG: DnaJ domain-containing protein, partial [Pseudomonadota bacterium]